MHVPTGLHHLAPVERAAGDLHNNIPYSSISGTESRRAARTRLPEPGPSANNIVDHDANRRMHEYPGLHLVNHIDDDTIAKNRSKRKACEEQPRSRIENVDKTESNYWRVPRTVSGLPLPEHVSSCWLAKDSPYCDNLDVHSTCQLSERGHFLIHTALRVITPYRLSRFAVAPRRCAAENEPRPLQRRDARGDTGAETTPTTKSKSVRRLVVNTGPFNRKPKDQELQSCSLPQPTRSPEHNRGRQEFKK